MYSRREFGKVALSGLALSALPLSRVSAAAAIDSTVRGVQLGVTSGSLGVMNVPGRDNLDGILETCQQLNIGFIDLSNGFFGPGVQGGAVGGQAPENPTPAYLASREAQRQWRMSKEAADRHIEVKRKFDAAGVTLMSISNTMADDCTDAELDAMFRCMQLLGIKTFQSNQTRVAIGRKIAPFAEKYNIWPAFHTHQQSQDPNEIASIESLTTLTNMSPAIKICLDIGHFYVGGNDPLAYLKSNPGKISYLHVKDQNKAGPAELGEGDLRLAEMLKFVRDNRYPIAFIIEREYTKPGRTASEECKWQMDYMRGVLES